MIPSQNHPLQILLVEDNPGDAELVYEFLASWSEANRCNVTHRTSLAETLLQLRQSQVDLILLDLSLPDSEGLNTVISIKACSQAPILILTGYNNEKLAVDALSAGAQDYLDKEHLNSRSLQRAILYALERARSQASHQRLLSQNPDGIVVVNASSTILFANPAAAKLWDNSEEQLINSTFAFPVTDKERTEIHILDREIEMHTVEAEWKGELAWVISLRDITEHKKLEKHLIYLAHHDPLTGLANRLLMNERLSQSLRSAKRKETTLAVLAVDLDRFKLVNDSLGHYVGDKLLIEVATRLCHTVREVDTVARTGGDEFVVVAEQIIDADGARNLATKILHRMAAPFLIDGQSLKATCSIGIALYPSDGATAEDLIKHADAAMYNAKQSGRNHYHFHDPLVHRRTMRRLALENELESALEQQQFRLYFQPQLDAVGVTGAEALLRWQHPDKGLLLPGEFIPLLEESHLIAKVEAWTLEAACNQIRQWESLLHKKLKIAVNLSVYTLQQSYLPHLISDVLARTGMNVTDLELEITESMLLKDVNQASKTLNALRELGVGIALDDFGTGYSSLGYLLQFPCLTTLKLDHSFVSHLNPSLQQKPRNRAILSTVMDLGHSLGMTVVAEGVESRRQMELLAEMGCDIYQGYLFSAPVPVEQWQLNFAHWNRSSQNWLAS